MVFAGDSLYYRSDLWKELTQHRDRFMSEEVICQYRGYIKTHMKLQQKHAGTPREKKIFYSVCLSVETYFSALRFSSYKH